MCYDISENCTSIPHKLRHMYNLHIKETEISQKRSNGIKNWKITYSVILSVLSNKTNLILGFSSPLTVRSARYVTRLIKIRERVPQILLTVISETTGISISAATIRCTLHQANLHGRRPRRKPLLKPKHKQTHSQFVNNDGDKPLSFLDSV